MSNHGDRSQTTIQPFRRVFRTLLVVMLATVLSAVTLAPVGAAAPTLGSVYQTNGGNVVVANFKHWNKTYFTVSPSPTTAEPFKVQVQAFRQGADPATTVPYYDSTTGPYTGTSADVELPPQSLQPGSTYEWRARWFVDGQGDSPSGWATGSSLSIEAATGNPAAPYPMSPLGPTPPADNILRFEAPLPGMSLNTSAVVDYEVEFQAQLGDGSFDNANPVFLTTASQGSGVQEFSVPSLAADSFFRWRVVTNTADAKSSSPSRWRYIQTTGPLFQQDFNYIPYRAGSYQAGFDSGDEISGMVASRDYPGVYWMIRDNGPGDRARIYAIKIDPATGLLANIDGYVTKEFDLTANDPGAASPSNPDGGPDGVENLDWEAINIDSAGNLWVADSGTYWDLQPQTRTEGRMYRIPEPDPYNDDTGVVDFVASYSFPAGEDFRNVEALFNVADNFYFVAKETPHTVWGLPATMQRTGNVLREIPVTVSSEIGNITGAEFSTDLHRFGLTTSPNKAFFWDFGTQFSQPATTAAADTLVAQALATAPTSHYYYRIAAAWEADGTYDQFTAGVTDPQRLQTFMQTEGLAFSPAADGYRAAMVSEFGNHVMFTPDSGYYNYLDRPGYNGSGTQAGPLVVPPERTQGTTGAGGFAADPVNIATGNFTDNRSDIGFGVGTVGLAWGRTYNSQSTVTGVLGQGWSTTYEQTVATDQDSNLIYTDSSGREFLFPADGNGGWDTAADILADAATDAGDVVLSFRDGSELRFDNGDLESITDWAGSGVTIARNASGNPTVITADNGPTLSVTYNASGHATRVDASDSRYVTYTYDANGHLASATANGDSTETYTVDSDGQITEIRDAENRLVVTNTYDNDGRVTNQNTPYGGTVSFAYEPSIGRTTVTDLPSGDVVVYEHDGHGRLVRLADADGKTLTRAFDPNGNLLRSTDRDGQATNIDVDSRGNVTGVTDPTGAASQQAYDSQDRVTSVTDPAGATSTLTYTGDSRAPSTIAGPTGTLTYTYTTDGQVSSITDADGVTATYTYDTARNLTSVTDGAGNTTTFTWDSAGNQLTSTDPDNNTTTYTYDTHSRPLTVTDPAGAVTGYTWDDSGRLLTITDADSNTTTYTYGPSGKLATITTPTGATTTYVTDANGDTTAVTDPNGNTSTLTYGELARLETVTDPLGRTSAYAYDPNGRITAITNPANDTSLIGYDDAGRATGYTDPTGATWEAGYNTAGQLTTQTDPLGNQTIYTYNTAGQVATRVDANNNTVTYTYTTAGRLHTITDGEGGVTTYTYDSAGRTTTVTDANGHTTTYTYDTVGRVATITTPEGRVSTFGYDNRSQLVGATLPGAGATGRTYDNLGRTATVTDATGAVTTYTYTDDGQLASATDALGNTTLYTYDPAGNLTAQTDPAGNITTFTYDDANQQTAVTDPLGRSTTYTYTPTGQIGSITDPTGRVETRSYDDALRLTARAYLNGPTTTYTYDAAGRRTAMADTTGTTTYGWDDAGNLTSQTGPDGDTYTYTLDANNRRDAITIDAVTTDLTRDAVGQITGIIDPGIGTITQTFDDDGLPASTTLPGGYHRDLTRNTAGQVTGYADNAAGITASTISYDTRGYLDQIVTGPTTVDYSYDTAGQLTAITGNNHGLTAAGYDNNGRRTTATVDGATQTYSYNNADELTAMTTPPTVGEPPVTPNTTIDYDQAGRLTELGNIDILYNTAGLPDTITTDTAEGTWTEQRVYNGDNQLVEVTFTDPGTNTTTHELDWDPYTAELLAITTDGETIRLINNGDTRLAAIDENGTTGYFGYDPQGNTIAITNPDTTTYTDTDRTAGSTKWYYLKAIDTSGTTSSRTGYVQGDTATTGDTTQPSIPTLLAVSNPTGTSVELNWAAATDNVAVIGYEVYRADTDLGTATRIAITDSTTYIDTDRVADSTQWYYLKAIDSSGNTSWRTGYVQGDTLTTGDTTRPAKPTMLAISNETGTSVELNWAAATDNVAVIGYEVYRADTDLGTATRIAITDSTTYIDTDRVADSTQWYYLKAIDSSGNTSWRTGYVQGDTLTTGDTTKPVKPTLLAVTNPTGTSVDLDWSATTDHHGIHGYQIYRADGNLGTPTLIATTTDTLPDNLARLAVADSYDTYGNPNTTPQPDTFGFGYRGELHIGSLIHLRNRDYNPQTGTFTTTDPLPGVPGTTTNNNPYHYTNNNPTNLTDPTGLRPNDNGINTPPNAIGSGLPSAETSASQSGIYVPHIAIESIFPDLYGGGRPQSGSTNGATNGVSTSPARPSSFASNVLSLLGASLSNVDDVFARPGYAWLTFRTPSSATTQAGAYVSLTSRPNFYSSSRPLPRGSQAAGSGLAALGVGLTAYNSYQVYNTPGRSNAGVATDVVARTATSTAGGAAAFGPGCTGGGAVGSFIGPGPGTAVGCAVGGTLTAFGGATLAEAAYDRVLRPAAVSFVDDVGAGARQVFWKGRNALPDFENPLGFIR